MTTKKYLLCVILNPNMWLFLNVYFFKLLVTTSLPDISLLPPIGPYCNRTWDGWLCWADSFPGDVMQMCPNYFYDFDPSGKARTHMQKIPFYLLKCTYSICIKHCCIADCYIFGKMLGLKGLYKRVILYC